MNRKFAFSIGGLFILISFINHSLFANNFSIQDSISKDSTDRIIFKKFNSSKPNFIYSPFSPYFDIQSKYSVGQNSNIVSQKKYKDSTINSLKYEIAPADYSNSLNSLALKSYWKEYSKNIDGSNAGKSRGVIPDLKLPPIINRILGKDTSSNLGINGSILIDAGYRNQFIDDPSRPVQLRRIGNLFFNQQIQGNLSGKIGDKVNLNVRQDTKAAFNFQNLLKFDWKTDPEDILQAIEFGNINWQLNSQLIPGVENIFGVKTLLRFGSIDLTLVAGQQRSKQECIILKGGVSGKSFEIRADNYDENRHFFLAQFFRENYEKNLRNLPMVSSGFKITRVEVYVTNRNQNTSTLRNLVGIYEIGDNKQKNQFVDNANIGNSGYNFFNEFNTNLNLRKSNLVNEELISTYNLNRGTDFDVLKGARRLSEREFTLHPDLGYISLVSPLRNDEILAVAFEYTYNGRKYKVGELTEDYNIKPEDEVIVLKLLKSATLRNYINVANPHPMWDLMLKNIYSLNVNSLQKEGFQLKIVYKDDASGIDNSNAIEGIGIYKDLPFVKALGFDKLNYAGDQNLDGNGNPIGDGNYDFIEGLTIDSKDGKIILPKLEPFGNTSMAKIFGNQDKYGFDELYRMTQTDAAQITTKNKFFIKGSYQAGSGASSINLFNAQPESVRITAGGQSLSRGQDFLVDGSGRVTILNQSIYNSGREIQVCYEKNDLFTNQIKTLLGTRIDWNVSRNVHLGGTFQKMKETPPAFFRRVAIGEEPVNNTMLGFDANIHSNSNLITKAIDVLPIVSTKETSVFDFSGEYAKLIPGVNRRVQNNAFVDDFESLRTIFNLTRQDFSNSMSAWRLGSVPQDFIPADKSSNPLGINDKRAKISVYNVDVSIYGFGNFSNNISGINANQVNSYNYERAINPQSLYPTKDFVNNITNQPLNILDIAYFPNERGTYNFNSNLRADGLLNQDPKKNFGAVTRALSSDTDFDNSNIEIIEFWMMDPFISGESGVIRDGVFNKNNNTGGKLIFQLGDISEDLMPDGFYNFENGIPAEGIEVNKNVELTAWGLAPKRQFVINAFDNQGKAKQDVGLDGLASSDSNGNEFTEKFHYSNYLNSIQNILNQDSYSKIENDPSNDDYVYYLDNKFGESNSIIERYKSFLGMEKNSELLTQQNNNGYSQANSILPDIEDLNNDNTINDNESYFEYEIDLRKRGLDNHKYVIDKINDGNANWYLFRIPIKNSANYKAVNNPSFKSVRFMRMVMTDFAEPVVLRMSQFQLSGYNYRTFKGKIDEYGGFDLTGQNTVEDPNTKFEVSSVNIEENGALKDNSVQYVLPPGFVRDVDITSLNTPRLNEQSLRLAVDKLKAGQAKGVFRNTSFDFINYRNLKLFISLQDYPERLDDLNNAAVFIRLGTDLTDNYYEVQTINLKKTNIKVGTYLDTEVWPLENEIDISFDDLKQVKIDRDRNNASLNQRYSKKIVSSSSGKEYLITIMGRPDQSTILNTMLGIRNISSSNSEDLSCSVWFDELRASGFDQTSGSAATGKMAIKLADIGNIVANGNFNNYGFGGVQTKISQRSREDNLAYGFTLNLNLDRFLPKKLNLSIPFFITYDRKNISPHFDPLDPDIVLLQSLNKFNSQAEKDDYRKLVEDNTVRRGYNFTNVKRLRGKNIKFLLPVSLSNFTFNYSFAELLRSNTLIQDYALSNYKGSLFYNYSPSIKNFQPFKGIKSNSPWISLIKDFNFTPLPNSILFKLDMDRSFAKTQLRNSDLTIDGVLPQYEKYWYLNRDYALSWSLTKSINLSYKTNVNAIIDEPYGELNNQIDKDSVITNLKKLGRPKLFDQTISLDYRLPLDKLPLTDWMEASYSHKINFNYWANSLGLKDENGFNFGNIIKNSKDRTISGQVDFVALYNRIKALRWVNSPVVYSKDIARNPGDEDDINIPPKNIAKSITRLLLSLRGIRINYNILETTVLPGFLPEPTGIFGITKSNPAPGWPFILGDQNDQIRFTASDNGWLTPSIEQNIAFTQTRNQKLSYSAQIDPNNNLKITVEGNYNRGDNFQVFYRPSQIGGPFENQSPVRSGNFSMTFLSFKTAFLSQDKVFETFRSNRDILVDRLNKSSDFQESISFDKNSQDVLIPSFFAAYSGRSAETVKYSPFYNIPLPNWKLDYNGLNLLPFINNNFSSFRITHQYSSTYSVGNFVSSLNYGEFLYDYRSLTLNSLLYPISSRFELKTLPGGESFYSLIPVYVMSTITFQEKFSPLIGFNAITKSKISLNFEIAQDRNVGLNLSNSQVAELSNKDLTFGVGFTKANVTLPIKIGGKRIKLPNDLKFTSNLTIRDTRTIQRKLDGESVITQGFINFQFRPQFSYNVTQKFSVMLYYDRMFNNPLVTNSYYRRVAQGGFQIRYSL